MAERKVTCSVCGGSGKYIYNDVSPCYGCNGHGFIIEEYDDSLPSSTPSSSGGGGGSRTVNIVANAGQDALSRDDLDGAIAECTDEIYHRRISNEISGSYGTMHFVALANRAEAYRRKGEYDKALADCASAEEILQKGKNLYVTTSREALKKIKSDAGQAFQKKYGRTITDGEIIQIRSNELEWFISVLVKKRNYWKPSLDNLVKQWELITGKQFTRADEKRILGRPFPKSSEGTSSDEPRSIGSKLLGILFGIIGAVVLLAIVMILLSILNNPILNLLGLLGSPVVGFILGYKLSRSLAGKLIILAVLIGGGIFFVWFNWSALAPYFGKAQTVSETAATATVNANVNFRKEPTTGDNIIRQLQQGDTVTLTGETNGSWTQIKHGSDTGWVSTEYLKK